MQLWGTAFVGGEDSVGSTTDLALSLRYLESLELCLQGGGAGPRPLLCVGGQDSVGILTLALQASLLPRQVPV